MLFLCVTLPTHGGDKRSLFRKSYRNGATHPDFSFRATGDILTDTIWESTIFWCWFLCQYLVTKRVAGAASVGAAWVRGHGGTEGGSGWAPFIHNRLEAWTSLSPLWGTILSPPIRLHTAQATSNNARLVRVEACCNLNLTAWKKKKSKNICCLYHTFICKALLIDSGQLLNFIFHKHTAINKTRPESKR